MEEESDTARAFDMTTLRTTLPKKRGLSMYYSGKSRSFACLADVHCLDDLKKTENPDAKRRKKYSEKRQRQDLHVPSYPYYTDARLPATLCSSIARRPYDDAISFINA